MDRQDRLHIYKVKTMEEKPDRKKSGVTINQLLGIGFVGTAVGLAFVFEADKLDLLFKFFVEVITKLLVL
jgi:hypothetical protein